MTASSTDAPKPNDPDDIRCECGRMLARRVPGGVELKCRRCGRLLRLTIEVFEDG